MSKPSLEEAKQNFERLARELEKARQKVDLMDEESDDPENFEALTDLEALKTEVAEAFELYETLQ